MGIDSLSSSPQPGGVVDISSTGSTGSSSSSSAPLPQDTFGIAAASLNFTPAADPASPSLVFPTGPSLLSILQTLGVATQSHRESSLQAESESNLLSSKLNANQASVTLDLFNKKQELLDEVNSWISRQKQAVNNVTSAYGAFADAVNAYNSAVGGISGDQINAINGAIGLWNSIQSMTPDQYNAYIFQRGKDAGAADADAAALGQTLLYNELAGAFNGWNNYIASLPLGSFGDAAANWVNALNASNVILNKINQERQDPDFKLDPISTYPNPFSTYSAPGGLNSLPGVPFPPGPGFGQLSGVSRPSQASVVSLNSLALSKVPDTVEIFNTPGWIALNLRIEFSQFVESVLGQDFSEQIAQILKSTNFGAKKFLPEAFIKKFNPNFLIAGSGGSGVAGGNAQSTMNRVIPAGLIKTTLDTNAIKASNGLVSTLQSAALGRLTLDAFAAAVPAASTFASSLGSVSQQSPAFAAILASFIGDKTQSAVASNQSRITANILLKNVIGAASAAGVTFGDLGTPSAGQLAEIAGSLSAAFNSALLGVTLASYEKSLGFPNLSLQVLANTDGLSQTDALTAAIGGSRFGDTLSDPLSLVFLKQSLLDSLVLQSGQTSETAAIAVNNAVNNVAASSGNITNAEALVAALQAQFIQQGVSSNVAALLASEGASFVNANIGVPALNQATPSQSSSGASANSVIDALLAVNQQIMSVLQSDSKILNEVLAKISADRDKVAAIIKETILADIRAGKYDLNLELRNPTVGYLRNAGFSTDAALYIANQVINQLTGNPLSPATGISADRLNELAGKGISQSAIAEALNKGPFSSELAFTNTLRGILERSGGGVGLDQALAGMSDVKVMDMDELTKSLSDHLDGVLTGLGAAQATITRDNILKAILDKKNPTSIVNQVADQLATLKKDANEAAKEDVHRRFIEDLRTFTRPSAELGFAITSMQEHAALPLSVAASVQAQGQTDILTGSRG